MNLTPAQYDILREEGLINGCGPATWRGPRPNFFFKADCDEHDLNYLIGGTEADRRWADAGFYDAMLKDTRRLSWWQKPYAYFKAWLFYRLVRWQGAEHFRYGPKLTTFEELVDSSTSTITS